MLTVQTKLSSSAIHGIGLFATDSIKAGETIWEYNKLTTLSISVEKWKLMKESLPYSASESIERFAYFRHGEWLLNLDDSRFMNHADKPNVGYDSDREICFALFDIETG